MAAAMTMSGCSSSPKDASTDSAPSASAPISSSTPATRPSPSATSAFCLDLSTFQVGVIGYSSEVGAATEGEPLDFEELRRKAALIANMGEGMQASAPPDVAKHFRTVLKAIETSASNLKSGATTRDVLEPVYGERNRPAFDAVNNYECDAASPQDKA